MGIKDYMGSTYDTFPDLQWNFLGPYAVAAVEQIKKEWAAATISEGDKSAREKAEEAPAGVTPSNFEAAAEVEATVAQATTLVAPMDTDEAPTSDRTPGASPTKSNQ